MDGDAIGGSPNALDEMLVILLLATLLNDHDRELTVQVSANIVVMLDRLANASGSSAVSCILSRNLVNAGDAAGEVATSQTMSQVV